MRIIFMGSPNEVICPLKALLASDHEVIAVVSQPARPAGRKRRLQDPPLAKFAKSHGLHVIQPASARDRGFISQMKELGPDVVVTAAYGQILSPDFLGVAKRATINIHPSLLPEYRGATPVAQAIADGKLVTGVTISFTVEKLDAGNIIVQRSYEIGKDQTTGELTSVLFELSSELLLEALQRLKDPNFSGLPQNETEVTYCKKIEKKDGLLRFSEPAVHVYRQFLAHQPWPGSFLFLKGKRLVLTEIHYDPGESSCLACGELVFDPKRDVLILGCAQGCLQIERLKPAGGKEVDAKSFWHGLKEKDHLRLSLNESS